MNIRIELNGKPSSQKILDALNQNEKQLMQRMEESILTTRYLESNIILTFEMRNE
jgi:hypothetical protein